MNVDTHRMVDCGCYIGGVNWSFDGLGAAGVARADDLTAADTTPRENYGPAPGPVIAPAAQVQFRRATEFAHGDNQSIVQ